MRNVKILFIDDEEVIVNMFESYLSENKFFTVHTELSSLKAVDRIKRERFDIIITDLNMPEIDGMEIIRIVQEFSPDSKLIVLTGYGTINNAVEAMKMGAWDYVQKPVKMEELSLRINKVINLENTIDDLRNFKDSTNITKENAENNIKELRSIITKLNKKLEKIESNVTDEKLSQKEKLDSILDLCS